MRLAVPNLAWIGSVLTPRASAATGWGHFTGRLYQPCFPAYRHPAPNTIFRDTLRVTMSSQSSTPLSFAAALQAQPAPVGDGAAMVSRVLGSGFAPNPGNVTALTADLFVYSPMASGLTEGHGQVGPSHSADLEPSGGSAAVQHGFDAWINLLAPWAQAGAATFTTPGSEHSDSLWLSVASGQQTSKGAHA